jgi:transcriptional regulator with XRE-family HTH domain
MLTNLRTAMKTKNISTLAIAKLIGTTEKTVNNKLNGISEFTLKEVLLIRECLFPEYDIYYLFKMDEAERTA